MDTLDKKIIDELQNNFPLETDPYRIVAERLGIGIDELWERVVKLVECGVIRRMGFSLDSRLLGYSSTLAALRVPQAQVQKASELIAGYDQITHCYLRADDFNIWFTVIAEDNAAIDAILEQIRDVLKLPDEDLMNLPARTIFKLDARFGSLR